MSEVNRLICDIRVTSAMYLEFFMCKYFKIKILFKKIHAHVHTKK